MFYAITEAFNTLRDFMSAGGSVLWLIAILAAFMWAIILERIWYFNAGHQVYMGELKAEWDSVSDHASWKGSAIKEKLISQARTEVNRYLPLINTCVALAPLFGLLGTVTGMIEVFQVMAFTGGGDARSMAGGVSKATLPTMAGMTTALSGVFATIYLNSARNREEILIKEIIRN
ncbi:MAG: MotA/TolQ/ExbB proton channel family protein [SAR86 cluster bacterium]|jgi:biopolymer transport protein ExbB|nr:MotA/TolQ/ExbB proton channel family protein [SAR86 cluster bacterium]MDA9140559.1 MotA/TolQ/ExbB proton channel family protein [Gammaproteobacteria bacterium]MBL6701996.1 MotA/TolQ/ExbB proton channel family protein [SAR86 cluster bacterium]MDA9964978.1 MotA/TolQ/ExbB proton channel family protein [Gammaproteobacteria bacterium]MDB3881401.1 MotA/TolQ/ExbB proton channel family protein [Gammaproteobacteria bacterium]